MPRTSFARMLVKFCQQRAPTVLSPRDTDLFQNWLLDLLAARMRPPLTERDYDWHAIAHACDVDHTDLQRAGPVLAPGLDALRRELARSGHVTVKRATARCTPPSSERGGLHRGAGQPEAMPRRRGPRSKPIVEFPESDGRPWTDPASFADALDLHMRRHGDTAKHLARVLEASATQVDATALNLWRRGVKVPRASQSLAALELIEQRYRLPPGYFRSKLKRGELRWSERDQGWEVLIPSVAFKNANSSFFGSKPFRLILPDLGGLYHYLEAYIDRHRRVLLKHAADPGTLLVKTVKHTSKDAAYCQNTFYEAWRLAIQRYGIHNPYTGRGAIKGLLPHGPHNVRDVLATHILKKTGSYEQASYAIQDTPEMVAKHYGRFLPQDKAALAAQILNKVWEAA